MIVPKSESESESRVRSTEQFRRKRNVMKKFLNYKVIKWLYCGTFD